MRNSRLWDSLRQAALARYGLRLATLFTGMAVSGSCRAAFNRGMGFLCSVFSSQEKHMKTAKDAMLATRSGLMAGCAALVVVAAMGFAGAAQARDNVSFSVGIGVPGVVLGVNNAYPVYSQPVYTQPVYAQPVYVQPQPVYIQPRRVYVQPAHVYVQPAPVYYQTTPAYYGRPHGNRHHGGGYYVQAPRPGYGQGYYGQGSYGQRYAPVNYQR
jgi:hypothetical protein